jgi:hypothetical protein
VLNLKVPDLLSVLAKDDPHATIRGLSSFPKQDRTPMALPVRLSFLGMVGIGTYLIALSLWYWLRRRGRPRPEDRLTLLAVVSSGPLAFLANELGWLSTEFGRQPWLVYNVFRTKAGITTAPGLGATFNGFTLLYMALPRRPIWLPAAACHRGPDRARSRTLDGGGHMSLANVLIVVVWSGVTLLRRARRRGTSAPHPAPAGPRQTQPPSSAGDRNRHGAGVGGQPRVADLVVTAFFSAFPRAFGALGTVVFQPATLAVGRHRRPRLARSPRGTHRGRPDVAAATQRLFSAVERPPRPSSSGRSRAAWRSARARRELGLWIGPFQLIVGALAWRCAPPWPPYSSAVEMTPRRENHSSRLFGRRGVWTTTAAVALALRRLVVASGAAPRLFDPSPDAPCPGLAAIVAGSTAVGALSRRHYRLARAGIGISAWRDRVGLGHRAVSTACGPEAHRRQRGGERPRS